MQAILDKLHLKPVNSGVCTGPDAWLDTDAKPIVSYNPTTGAPIASVVPATAVAYHTAVRHRPKQLPNLAHHARPAARPAGARPGQRPA
jgi:hypothetical protein